MKNIPGNERIWVTIQDKNKKNRHVITSKEDSRSMYYLYDCDGEHVEKLGHGRSPIELEHQWPL